METLDYQSHADAVRWLSDPAPTLVIVGSGISMSAPSSAPGVGPFLTQTLDLLETVTGVRPSDPASRPGDFRDRIFPEVVYGGIAEAFRTDSHLRIWEIFNRETARRLGASPNTGHLAIAYLAAANGWPVITTNYDCFLESAAEQFGTPVTTDVPMVLNHPVKYSPRPGAMTLIKVHGSAEQPRSIRSTVSDLSRLALLLDRMSFAPVPVRILLVGYSGRDFDLFPFVARRADQADVLWVSLEDWGNPGQFEKGHRAHSLNVSGRSVPVKAYAGSWEDLAASVPGAHRAATDPVADSLRRDQYAREVRAAVDAHVGELLRRDPGRSLAAFAGILGAVGQHQDVRAIARRAGEISDRPAHLQTLLWAAHASSSTDQFEDAQVAIRDARRDALLSRSLFDLGRCSIAQSYARAADARLSVVPALGASPDQDRESVRWFMAVLRTTIVYFIPSAFARGRLGDLSRLPDTSTYRFAADFEEHLIRLMALVNHLRNRLPALKPMTIWVWRLLARRCASIGYTWGVFNASKYLSREDAGYQGPFGSVTSGEIMGDLIGQTISLRDAGRHELSLGHEVEARDFLDQALGKARQVGCPSLELKIMLIRLRGRIDRPYDEADVTRLLEQAQASGLVRERAAILAALTDTPSRMP